MRAALVIACALLASCSCRPGSPLWDIKSLKDAEGNLFVVHRHVGCTYTVIEAKP